MVGAAPQSRTYPVKLDVESLLRALGALQRAVRALKAENAELRAQLRAARD